MNFQVVRNPAFWVAFLTLFHRILEVTSEDDWCINFCEELACKCETGIFDDVRDESKIENCVNENGSDCNCGNLLDYKNNADYHFCGNDTNKPSIISEGPSASPSLSLTPTVSVVPSMAPSVTSSPTVDCTCCNCTHTSGCNNDPHYRAWDYVSYYDFQGSCDQIAIDNAYIQLQIRTRPRGYYSTVTEAGLLMKSTGEQFNIRATSGSSTLTVAHNLTAASDASYSSISTNYYRVTFDTPGSVASYILFRKSGTGINVAVHGQGYIFTNSEGMFGSWNHGGVRYRNGTQFDLSGGWSGTRGRSIELAQDWSVPLGESLMVVPSDVCDAISTCGSGSTFGCTDVRRLGQEESRKLLEVNPGCDRTCADISDPITRAACEEDILISGDETWACDPDYIDPIVVQSSQCEFQTEDESMCSKKGDACQRLGGYCKQGCEADDGHVCVPGLCSDIGGGRRLKKPKSPKAPKAPEIEACQCFVPVDCAKAP